jgi:hypothetical protein
MAYARLTWLTPLLIGLLCGGCEAQASEIRAPSTWTSFGSNQSVRIHRQATTLAMSVDGKTVARAGPDEIVLQDLASGTLRVAVADRAGPVSNIGFSPDGAIPMSMVFRWGAAGLSRT